MVTITDNKWTTNPPKKSVPSTYLTAARLAILLAFAFFLAHRIEDSLGKRGRHLYSDRLALKKMPTSAFCTTVQR
jgi:hypothetical protein